MMWRFRAADATGTWHQGELSAASEAEAMASLRARGWWIHTLAPVGAKPVGAVPVGAEALPSRASHTMSRALSRGLARVGGQEQQDLAVALRTLATLLAAGIPLERALEHAARGTGDATALRPGALANHGSVPEALGAVHQSVHGGSSLAEAMGRHAVFPPFVVASVQAAEVTGALAGTLDRVAQSLERRLAMQTHVRTVLIYPIVLAVSSLVATAVILLLVVPQFAALVADSGGTLPWSTRVLVQVSRAFGAGGWLLLPGLVAVLWWWRGAAHAPAVALARDARWLHWPVLGSYIRQRDAARYLETLATALAAGVPLLPSMALARQTMGNAALATRAADAESAVRNGQSVAAALRGALPDLSVQLLEAGESGGALADLAARAGMSAAAASDRQLTRVVALIEPAMILLFGGLVGFVALALLQAIYRVNAGLT